MIFCHPQSKAKEITNYKLTNILKAEQNFGRLFSIAFSWTTIISLPFWSKYLWNLFWWMQSTICHHYFRQAITWTNVDQVAIIHSFHPSYWRRVPSWCWNKWSPPWHRSLIRLRRNSSPTTTGQELLTLSMLNFSEGTETYLHFMSFLHIDMIQEVEILSQERQGPTYST